MDTKVLNILEGMKSFLTASLSKRETYFTSLKAFTRLRKFGLHNLAFFLIFQPKRSLTIELNDFYSNQSGKNAIAKSSFSKARYLLRHELLKDWNDCFCQLVYGESGPRLHRWKGFHLKGIDGTTVYLFQDEEVAKEFGSQSNQYVSKPMARAGYEMDLLNGFVTQSWLGPLSQGEQVFAAEFLKHSKPGDMRIYDRYFASYDLIFQHLNKGVEFTMRTSISFNNVVIKFVNSGKQQSIVEFPITDKAFKSLNGQGFEVSKQDTVKVRLLRIDIGQDEPEILITSLLNVRKYPHSCFKELYNYRWGSETCFDKVKNKLQMECFSGLKVEAIYQDFFSTVIAANLHTLVVNSCDRELEKINVHRETWGEVNQNVSIGLLKARLVQLFYCNKPQKILDELQALFLKNLEPVRPGRSFPRTKPIRRLKGKYQTFKNYKRAV